MEPTDISLTEMDELSRDIFAKRAAIDEVEESLKILNKELMQLQSKFTEILKLSGRDSYATPMGNIGMIQRLTYRMPDDPEDRAALFADLRERGEYEGLVTINAQTFSSYCKKREELENSEGLLFTIPGVQPPTIFESVRVTKKRNT